MATTLTLDMIAQITGTSKNVGTLANALQTINQNISKSLTNGTGDNKSDRVALISATASASPDTYDLDGGSDVVDEFGNGITFTKIRGLFIRNKSVTATEKLIIGGDWFTTAVLNGTTPSLDLQPDSFLFLTSAVDGYTVTAGTGDVLSIDPSADTIAYDLILIGED